MRNYTEEIKELTSEINDLNLAKSKKESQLENENRKRTKREKARRFRETEGTVARVNKWITFEDRTGVKQTRAPKNLFIFNHGRKCASRPGTDAHRRK